MEKEKKKTKAQETGAAVVSEPKEAKAPASEVTPSVSHAVKKGKFDRGRVYINASYNNTVVTVADGRGDVLAWATAGSLGFAGPKKATPFASSKVIAAITEKLKSNMPTEVEIIVKGIGGGRDSAIRSIINQGFNVISIKDVTPIPHNGPRPRKVRRV